MALQEQQYQSLSLGTAWSEFLSQDGNRILRDGVVCARAVAFGVRVVFTVLLVQSNQDSAECKTVLWFTTGFLDLHHDDLFWIVCSSETRSARLFSPPLS